MPKLLSKRSRQCLLLSKAPGPQKSQPKVDRRTDAEKERDANVRYISARFFLEEKYSNNPEELDKIQDVLQSFKPDVDDYDIANTILAKAGISGSVDSTTDPLAELRDTFVSKPKPVTARPRKGKVPVVDNPRRSSRLSAPEQSLHIASDSNDIQATNTDVVEAVQIPLQADAAQDLPVASQNLDDAEGIAMGDNGTESGTASVAETSDEFESEEDFAWSGGEAVEDKVDSDNEAASSTVEASDSLLRSPEPSSPLITPVGDGGQPGASPATMQPEARSLPMPIARDVSSIATSPSTNGPSSCAAIEPLDVGTENEVERCGTFTLLVRAGRGKNYQADNLRCDPEEVFVL